MCVGLANFDDVFRVRARSIQAYYNTEKASKRCAPLQGQPHGGEPTTSRVVAGVAPRLLRGVVCTNGVVVAVALLCSAFGVVVGGGSYSGERSNSDFSAGSYGPARPSGLPHCVQRCLQQVGVAAARRVTPGETGVPECYRA